MTPERLLEPARWAIRSCRETDVVTNLACRYYPSVRLTGGVAEARAKIEEALANWRQLGLPFAEDVEGVRRYDPDEVINFAIASSLLGRDDFWARHSAPLPAEMQHWFSGKSQPLDEVPDIRSLPSRACRIKFERTYYPSAETAGSRLRLKLPLPLDSPHFQLERLEVTSSEGERVRVNGNRGELLVTQGEVRPVTLSFSASASAMPDLGTADELTPESRALYTARKEGLIVISPAVQAMAEWLAAGERDPETLAHRFYQHLLEHYIHGRVAYRAIDFRHPTDGPLEDGHFDCQTGAALFIALCRAHEIPARLVHGCQIYSGYQAGHYWAEVWLDGLWRPFDFANWDSVWFLGGEGWRSVFAGQIEYRLPLQRFPHDILGAATIGLAPEWHQLFSHEGPATVTQYLEARSLRPLYRDSIALEWAPAADSV